MYNIDKYFIKLNHDLIYSEYNKIFKIGKLSSDELLVYSILISNFDTLRFHGFIDLGYYNNIMGWEERRDKKKIKNAIQGLINKNIIKKNEWMFDILETPNEKKFVSIIDDYLLKILQLKHCNKSEILHTYIFILKHIRMNFEDTATEINNWCYFNINNICSVLDICVNTAWRYVKILKDLGVLISENAGIVRNGENIYKDRCYYSIPEHKKFLEHAINLRLAENKKNNIILIDKNIKPFDGLVEKYKGGKKCINSDPTKKNV